MFDFQTLFDISSIQDTVAFAHVLKIINWLDWVNELTRLTAHLNRNTCSTSSAAEYEALLCTYEAAHRIFAYLIVRAAEFQPHESEWRIDVSVGREVGRDGSIWDDYHLVVGSKIVVIVSLCDESDDTYEVRFYSNN